MILSAFTVWSGESTSRNGRLVINIHCQRHHWRHRSVRVETLPSFDLPVEVQKRDRLMSWDVRGRYRHMYLHPDKRDLFLFRYSGR